MKFSDINDILAREVGAAEVHSRDRKKPARVSAFIRKTVLVHLAMRENSDGSGAYPSKSRIARELECSRRAVQLALDTLEEPTAYGPPLINCVGTRMTRKGPVKVFKIDLTAVAALPNVKRDDEDGGLIAPTPRTEFTAGVNDIHSRGERGSQVGVNEVHTEPHLKPHNNQKGTKPKSSQQETSTEEPDSVSHAYAFLQAYPKKGNLHQVWQAWNKVTERGHDPRDILAGVEKLIRAVASDPSKARFIKQPHIWLEKESWAEAQAEEYDDWEGRQAI